MAAAFFRLAHNLAFVAKSSDWGPVASDPGGRWRNVSDSVVIVDRDSPATDQAGTRSHGEFVVLLVLFLAFRLLAVIFLRPGGQVYLGGHDITYYRALAELSLEGYLPYLSYWMEYPPLFPLALVGLYRLSLLLPSWPDHMVWFQLAVSGFLLAWETGNLALVYAIARRLHGPATGLRAAVIYACLFLPVFTLTNWFDVFPLFFLLLSLYLALRGWPLLAGLSVGAGLMVKLIPAVAGPATLLLWRRWRERLLYVLGGLAILVAVSLPLYLANGSMFLASFRSMLSRSSWLTPWALLDGYYGVGFAPTVAARFDPANATWQLHSSVIPSGALELGLFVLMAVLYSRRLVWQRPLVLVASTALTLNLFFILSKGWSPQFAIYVLALLAVLLPNGWGVAYALLLTFNTFLEWPIQGIYFPDEHWLLAAIIAMRMALLLLVAWEYLVLLRPAWRFGWQRWRRLAAWPAAAVLLLLAVFGANSLLGIYWRGGELFPVANQIRAHSLAEQALVASSQKAFYGLKAFFPADRFYAPRQEVWGDDQALRRSLGEVADGRSQVWVVLDHSEGEPPRQGLVLAWFDAWGSRASDGWVGSYHVLCYVPYRAAGPPANPSGAVLGGSVALDGWQSSATAVRPGQTVRLELLWRTVAAVPADLKAFVHVVDEQGKLVTQMDRPVRGPAGALNQWQPGTTVRDAYDLALPSGAPAGLYRAIVGLYDPQTGKRLPVTAGGSGDSLSLLELRLQAAQ